MNLTFRDIRPDDRGVLLSILEQSYQPLKELNEPPWIPPDDLWAQYDTDVFESLDDPGEKIYLTQIEGVVLGFASFSTDGNETTIGRNSVLPEHCGKGVGTAQVVEIIRRAKPMGIRTLHVWTGEHRFFEPAQRMYLRSGFVEVERKDDGNDVGRVLIRYKLYLSQ